MAIVAERELPSEVLVLQANGAGLPTDLASGASGLLYELLGNDEKLWDSIEYIDDHDWTVFPQLGKAFKDAGGEVLGFCVGIIAELGIWAISAASNRKARQSSVRAALCLELLAQAEPDDFQRHASKWEAFAELLGESDDLPELEDPRRHTAPPRAAPSRPAPARPAPPRALPHRAAPPRPAPARAAPSAPRRAAAAPADRGDDDKPAPGFVRLELPLDLPLIVERKLPSEVWALLVASQGLPVDVASGASTLLEEIIGDEEIIKEVEYLHDPDWTLFPEIGAAVKAAGGQELSLCLAVCTDLQIWAVAVASKKKARETSARAALCLALLAQDPEIYDKLAPQWPAFAEILEAADAAPEGSSHSCAAAARSGRDAPDDSEAVEEGSAEFFEEPPEFVEEGEAGEGIGSPRIRGEECEVEPDSGDLPEDVPRWLSLPGDAEIPVALDDMEPTFVAVYSTGSGNRNLYGRVNDLLRRLAPFLGEPEHKSPFHYVDEESVEEGSFDVITTALVGIAPPEPVCLALCKESGQWGVGIGRQRSTRMAAAKLALVGQLAVSADEAGDIPMENWNSEFPAVSRFMMQCRDSRV